MPLPSTVSEATRRLNPHLFPSVNAGALTRETVALIAGKRLRQKSGPKLNELETAWQAELAAMYPGATIRAQSVTLVLANGVRYTPDFFDLANRLAWETKGHMRDDAAVKIKLAAALYPEIVFRLVTKLRKKDGGGWQVEVVLK